MPTPAAFEKAAGIAAAAAHKKQLELEHGAKLSRRERAQLMRAMMLSVQACANIGYRIKQGISPDSAMMETAMQQPATLKAELEAAAEHNPELAHQVATAAGIEIHAAATATVQPAATSSTHSQQEQTEPENQPAALPSVEAAASCHPPLEPVSQPVQTRLGRPSEFTQDEADRICEWIQSGNSLNSYCKQHGRKSSTIYAWMRESVSFKDNYARAHADRADTLVEDMLDIADAAEKAVEITDVMSAKLRIETRKWIAERMRPEKYGQKVQVEHKQPVTFNLGVSRAPKQEVIDINPVQPTLDKA